MISDSTCLTRQMQLEPNSNDSEDAAEYVSTRGSVLSRLCKKVMVSRDLPTGKRDSYGPAGS